MAKRQLELIHRANSLCIELEQFVAAQVKIHHQDILIACELFFRESLNRIYKWNLKDDNSICGRQQDSFDLSDRDRRIPGQLQSYLTTLR